MRRGLTFCLSLLLFAHAHSGFNTLAWNETWGAYTVTVLEDFHTTSRADSGRSGQAQLFVRLSEGEDAAPESTQVEVTIHYGDTPIYQSAVPYLSTNSEDGKTFYAGYLLTLPLEREGLYRLELSLEGPLGAASQHYAVRSQRDTPSWTEYLPSALLLLIVLGGVALLFAPLPSRNQPQRQPYSDRKDTRETSP